MSTFKQKPLCAVDGCEGQIHLKGWCVKHYSRWRKHGSTDDPRPPGFGQKMAHPLWPRWRALVKDGRLCEEWLDFWTFVRAVSPQPENSKKLERPDMSRPYGPDNWMWNAGPKTPAETNAYMKAWREANPQHRWSRQLREAYGLTVEEYDTMLAAQNGVCAICGGVEKTRNRVREGTIRRMAVDHDHDTGKVRGILCGDCNRGLGAFREDAGRMFSAIQYLARHKPVGKVS